jgi:hypothetical protein
MLRPIPQKLRICHAILLHLVQLYGLIISSSRRAIRDKGLAIIDTVLKTTRPRLGAIQVPGTAVCTAVCI